MKGRDLERLLRDAGCQLRRHGGRHDIWENPTNNRIATVPRHAELLAGTARAIFRQLGLEAPSSGF